MNDNPKSEEVDAIIAQYDGWKADILKRLRIIIADASPAIAEAVKWKMPSNPKGLPVWTHQGNVCMIQTFKNDTKLVFFQGSSLHDSHQLFNARLKNKTERAIELHEGDPVDEAGIAKLVVDAVDFNANKAKLSQK